MLGSLQFFDRKKFCRFYRQNYAQLFSIVPIPPVLNMLDAHADTTMFLLLLFAFILFCAVNEGMPSSINVSYFLHFEAEALRTV
jgi:hypothetical protein